MSSSSASQFGSNQWLVDEMFTKFQEDPSSVDPAWHEFLADYSPESAGGGGEAAHNGGRPNGSRRSSSTRPVTATTAGAASTPSAAPADDGSAAAAPSPAPKTTPKASVQSSPAAAPTIRATVAPPAPARPASTPSVPAKSSAPMDPTTTAPAGPPPENTEAQPTSTVLRGASAAVAKNMSASLSVPTATSVRAVPAKLLADIRVVINNHLKRTRGGKVSFTHLLGYAIVQAVNDFPSMNRYFAEVDGKPTVVQPAHVNLGLAIDLPGRNGNRSLVVAAIKNCETMTFQQFWSAYEDVVRKAREGKLTAEDFSGTTISLTNPGTIGTVHSVPRLVQGQGTIVGAGAMEYPAEFQGASEQRLADLGIGKVMTLTSTYDHRIIQGAESGDFLRTVHQLLLGEKDFYDRVYASLHIPYEPIRWRQDIPEGEVDKTARVLELIEAYRNRGHLMADTDPLSYGIRNHPDLDVLNHDLTLWDLDREFPVGGFNGKARMKLRDVLGVLRDSYCRTTGVEYTHILEPEQQAWIQERVEAPHTKPSTAEQKYILSKLNAAEAFETFLQTKYVGQKRFSLEGSESVIPMMDTVLDASAEAGLAEVVIGMPHRGRLNVLANIVGKPYSKIFSEFEGNLNPTQAHGSGDVKYHLGAEGKYMQMFGDNEVTVSLTANPSHLEAVDPVLEGIVRAKQDVIDMGESGFTVLPLMLHGDAAFAGQGVVAETLNLALLRGYRTGGTVHIVVNNQVGFTTAPEHSRSSEYCTDVAKMIGAPVFHVNGDDPEACVWVARIAVEFRQAFGKDVVIDLISYRRRGHNEGDDPSMTQPAMYDVIDTKRSVRKSYTESLIGRGDLSMKEAEDALRDYQGQLERVFNEVRDLEKYTAKPSPSVEQDQVVPASVRTAVDASVLRTIGEAHVRLPEGFTAHPRVKPVLERRAKMSVEGGVDWAYGELLALGSLVLEGKTVRLSGQDTRRGTFTQRHSVVIDRRTGAEYTPLQNLSGAEGKFLAYDSALSEFAAVGFEYGYSVGNPDAMVLWEAQFGDFVNGAQSIIDEFISSGEAKWGQRSDVVLLLPHGHEGQGPDHTSGRIERFLLLCAEGSMTVAVPSTPANYFHLLRRHATDGVHRPLVVFTPKSMLRSKAAVSAVEDFTEGKFMSVIDDPNVADPSAVTKIVLCSGKLYWELAAKQAKDGITDTAVVRVEQLYPVPRKRLAAMLERYPSATEVRWTQEEPANQGAWPFFGLALPDLLGDVLPRLTRVSRRAMAAPSAGSSKVHAVEQEELIRAAFA
ncbi:multifunctional oxoglutarate decarboxylase/oxoglutarate dehydrogenase thiamine pyrophosphate-binding subunit/dihydrolipoyllysine-residue succinyltransferase subunit [Rhodococcus antarcticus]|uniref:Multifunctional oxoglutarate decarboxylase/oxoglutarate dehydrogenase thiamine pyrophosphate-binding subunit/dihydrolipoyllysine-residue succinyltransferase subunit n=1 Tax=Rhodococcus antarcticus TaxID=2987751 RepID=A0ABY6P1P4_9NOCA|nr:multifunctional oxoglutarate decarboxylase/oxoglutarate dehydrogenase thiamine pyrophosphate-binding subunit/dihydrolipoyllysine-residue succinyltransferase subunit [Rhodococcus antarcticus]UZJ25584.1 multifunctional oxoglutarate decarboxylase/oxoglutarate dehydrogenase thiamine pyrophosphate-binding subunit/dihydrolipoyllysine-residue succinyltransferase subunit [Rhodococcus antarcticus]